MAMNSLPVSELFGVGKTIAKKLKASLNIETCTDLIFQYPRKFDDFSVVVPIAKLAPGMTATVAGTVQLITNRRSRSRKIVTEAMIADESGAVKALWFHQPYLLKTLPVGTRVRLSGKASDNFFDLSLVSPAFEKTFGQESGIHTGRLVPSYPLTAGITQKQFRLFMKLALDSCLRDMQDDLPSEIKRELLLPDLQTALRAIHFPATADDWTHARRRLAFDELLSLQVIQRSARKALESQPSAPIRLEKAFASARAARLPFVLTASQQKALDEILSDMARPTPMNRLLEGDVGSGKTVVSALAAERAVLAGLQVAYLAPTEILAEQVYKKYSELLGDYSVCLLTGKRASVIPTDSVDPSAPLHVARDDKTKKKLLQSIQSGDIQIIVGTHALLEERVGFKHLGLAIIDEQHRFGVRQRKTLREKNENGLLPHLLSMTATPIPRSLALTVYGDLDLSIIDTLPAGRKKIITKVVPARYREWTYGFMRRQIASGQQAFVICPMIEPSDAGSAKSVKLEYARLSKDVFSNLRLGMLHGKLSSDKKSAVMRDMLEKKIDILVATSVIEVGIDIPNATIMLIEGAERFGLAQLHQFRGRVGRASHQSYCFLLPSAEEKSEVARLRALVRSANGFELAEEDLRERGAGDMVGNRQSGLPSLKIASLADHDLIAASRRWADRIVNDPHYANFADSIMKKEVHLE